MKPLINLNGITIKELKEAIKDLPETDPRTGEDYQVWIDGTDCKSGLSNAATCVYRLNKGDIILEVTK